MLLKRNWLNNADLSRLASASRELRDLTCGYLSRTRTLHLNVGKQYFIEKILVGKLRCRPEELELRGAHDYDVRNLASVSEYYETSVVKLIESVGTALRSVRVVDYMQFSDAGMSALAKSCAATLETFVLDRRPQAMTRNGYNGVRSTLFTNFAISFSALLNACKGLRRLEFNWCRELTDACLADLGTRLPSLTHFISCWSKITVVSAMHISTVSTLQDLHLYTCREWNDEGLIAVGKGCLNLRNVSLVDVAGISDAGLSTFLEMRGGALESLHLSDLDALTSASVREIEKRCPNLKRLRMSHFVQPEMANDADAFGGLLVGLKSLEELALSWMRENLVTDAALRALSECAHRGKRLSRVTFETCHGVSLGGVLAFARVWNETPFPLHHHHHHDDDEGENGKALLPNGGLLGSETRKKWNLHVECFNIGTPPTSSSSSSSSTVSGHSDKKEEEETSGRGRTSKTQFLEATRALRDVRVLAVR